MVKARMVLLVAVLCVAAGLVWAAEEAKEAKTVQLPKPQMEGGKPLMQALKERHTAREFSDRKLSDQVLSNLLWAADGVNRPDGKRTAPSAMNWQEIDIYVATADGLFLYDAKANALKEIVAEDVRAVTGQQPFVKEAAVNLIYVADYARMGGRAAEETKNSWASVAAGCIVQNVYLFCASEGLNTVVRGMVPREQLGPKMNLRPEQKILLAQTVGYPKQ
jgi:nitroreductase